MELMHIPLIVELIDEIINISITPRSVLDELKPSTQAEASADES